MSSKRSLGDILCLLRFLLLHHPDCCRVMYCYSTFLFHYYSYSYSYSSTQFCPLDFSEMPWSNFGNRGTKIMGWGDVRYCFAMAILVLIINFPHIIVRSISRRYLDQTLWNLVGISYAMWSCARKGWFFQNGCRCHGNGQNAKKLKKHKNDHSRLLAEQKLMKLDRNNIHS